MSAPATGEAAGLYLLANDRVLDWVWAFLSSLRRRNPNLPVAVIPWDERMGRVERAAATHGAWVLDPRGTWADAIAFADEVARRAYPGERAAWPWFRKLASFHGPFARFAMIDADVVWLSDPADLLRAAAAHPDCDLAFLARSPGFIYAEGPLRRRMVGERGSREFNGGCWVSHRGRLARDAALALASEVPALGGDLAARMYDQSFLNYAADTLGWRTAALQDWDPDLAASHWPNPRRRGRLAERDGTFRWSGGCEPENEGRRVALLHWAGMELAPSMPYWDVFARARWPGAGRAALAAHRAAAWVPHAVPWALGQMRRRVAALRGRGGKGPAA